CSARVTAPDTQLIRPTPLPNTRSRRRDFGRLLTAASCWGWPGWLRTPRIGFTRLSSWESQMFRRCLLALAATLLALTCTLPVAGRAQIEGELVPYAGLYLPTTSVMYQGPKQQASPTLGARVTVWFLRRAGIEGTVNYTPSNL